MGTYFSTAHSTYLHLIDVPPFTATVPPPSGEHSGRLPAVLEGADEGGAAGREVVPAPQRRPHRRAEDRAGMRSRPQLAPQPPTQQAGEGGVQDEGQAVRRRSRKRAERGQGREAEREEDKR